MLGMWYQFSTPPLPPNGHIIEENLQIQRTFRTPVELNRGRGWHPNRSRLPRTRGDDRHLATVARNSIVGAGSCGPPQDRPDADSRGAAALSQGRSRGDYAQTGHHGFRDQFEASAEAARGATRAGAADGELGCRAR